MPLLVATADLTANADLAEGLSRCAAIERSSARLACFDALASHETPKAVTGPRPPPIPETQAPREIESAPMTASTTPAASAARSLAEDLDRRRSLGVRLYRPNYLLPVTYNDNPNRNIPDEERLDIPFLGDALDNVEMKFQISFEVPLWTDILERDLDVYFAYTQLAFFQAYNQEYSSPFRETNYEPELGLNWQPDLSLLGWRLHSTRLMLDHQSNGRSDPLSRSWNRLIGQAEADRGPYHLALRIWSPLEPNPSDNPDIYEYLGYGELHAGYDLGKQHVSLMFRNPTHPSVQIDWTYSLGGAVKLYLQYFNGYGESLLDFDHSVNRIGLGFLLNEWP
ncbi:phospholipase A [Imhoffiella purpurea]|uniref:Phospholipase A1 n=1 Tax=Imhoffiella purpurea TaxID=1249627 RepID=W9VK03_9GAMM|nr:phospholipase A [Imhoffiella purpurea]EXJ16412.1 Phospholipase A1 precursor [Imhoffiella purpurea]